MSEAGSKAPPSAHPPPSMGPVPTHTVLPAAAGRDPGQFFFLEPLGQLLVPRAPMYADWLGRAEPGHTTTGAAPGTDALTWTEVPKGMQTT